jgi:hypothetical protein
MALIAKVAFKAWPASSSTPPRRICSSRRLRPLPRCPSSAPSAVELRRELAELEDRAAATGWAWDAALSLDIDGLHVWLEARRA